MPLANLSDAQTKEVHALFNYLDADRDGLLSPRSVQVVCDALGFHLEPPRQRGDPGSLMVSRDDLMAWLDSYAGQSLKRSEIRLALRFALFRSHDVFNQSERITRAAVEKYIASEQHIVRPEVLDALFDELGDGETLGKEAIETLMRQSKPTASKGKKAAAGRIR